MASPSKTIRYRSVNTGGIEGKLQHLLYIGRDHENERDKHPATFCCEVMIRTIRTEHGWYYLACSDGNCNNEVIQVNGQYWCNSCTVVCPSPKPRLRLTMDVEDETATVVVKVSGRAAESLVAKPAAQLLKEFEENKEQNQTPIEITRLSNTTRVLEITTNTYFDNGAYESFTAHRIEDSYDAHQPAMEKAQATTGAYLLCGRESITIGTISDMLTWSSAGIKATFHCEIQISEVRTRHGWYYYSCTTDQCMRAPIKVDTLFWCEKCELTINQPNIRLALQLEIKDETSSTVVNMYDDTVEKLALRDAAQLLYEKGESEDSMMHPTLQTLPLTKHIVEIRTNTYYTQGGCVKFTCNDVFPVTRNGKAPAPTMQCHEEPQTKFTTNGRGSHKSAAI